jgi:two-component system, NarL family, captular synthesis response regulator RcsB
MSHPEKITVFVADHRSAVLTSLYQWFDSQERYRPIGRAADVHQLFSALSQQASDLVVMGDHLCGDGFAFLRELRRCLPHVPIVVFTSINDPHALRALQAAGATGIISADDEMKDFERVCSRVLSGAPSVMSHRVAALCDEVAEPVPALEPEPQPEPPPPPLPSFDTTPYRGVRVSVSSVVPRTDSRQR